MLTKDKVLDWMREDLSEMQESVEKSKNEIKQFLSRFDDLDSFFNDANKIVEYYFNNQLDYDNIDDFKKYLKEQIKFYINSFSLAFEEKIEQSSKLQEIEYSYDKLIYFWIHNPIENIRNNENKELSKESEWTIWGIKSFIWNIFK